MRELPVIVAALLALQQQPAALKVAASLEPGFALATTHCVELDTKAGAELLAIGERGEVRTFAFENGAFSSARGTLDLAEPERTLYALAPRANGAELYVASPRGLELRTPATDGGFAAEPVLLAPRARSILRTSTPLEAPLAQDVDGDGVLDAVVPEGAELGLWLRRPATGQGAASTFERGARLRVPIGSGRSTVQTALSDELRSAITIPNLRRADLDGDGRQDLIVEEGEVRAFHLVRADGTIPETPDSRLDLAIFKDTTPRAELAPGRTLAGLDRTLHEMRDLNGDKIPDHVIAHRRKVWVFRGSKGAPRFETPSSVLKTADDVTALLLVDLDADARPDLVLIKVQVPSVGELLRGLVGEWQVDIAALGYRAGGERDFEPSAAWRSELAFRVPPILSILKDPEEILERFEQAGKKLRANAEGDLDGDGADDVALVSEDGTKLEVWRGDPQRARAGGDAPEAIVRRVLFEDPEKVWDIERLAAWLSGYAERRVQELTGGRAADAAIALRKAEEWSLVRLEAQDLDGDGRAELVLRYDAPDGAKSAIDALVWKP